MGKDVLFSGLCRDVKYLTHAFNMCQGLEVEGLRYETGVTRVWFAEHYSRSMQTVSAATMKLQRPVSTEAVFNLLVCTWPPDCGDGGMAQRVPKGSMKQVSQPMISKQQPSTSPQKWSLFWGFASGYASGLCFGVCFGGMLRKSDTFHQYIFRTTEKILTHIET